MIGHLKKKYELPLFEHLDSLTANEIMDKIRDFHSRWEKSCDDLAPTSFLELLHYYPISICKREMTDTLKTLITLAYFDSKPQNRKDHGEWKGYSYDDLSLIFCRSKASIHDAVKEKEIVVGNLLLKQSTKNNQTNEQPSQYARGIIVPER